MTGVFKKGHKEQKASEKERVADASNGGPSSKSLRGSERNHMEGNLREAQEKWQALIDNLPDVVLIVSRDGTILEMNRAAQKIVPAEVAVGTTVFEYVPSEQSEVMRKALEHVFQRGEPYSYEIAGTGTAGEYASWYATRLVPIEREGHVVAAVMISRDITDRKRAEEATKQALEEWQITFDLSHDLMMLLDSHNRVIKANLATEKFLQKPRTEICGKKCYQLIHGTDAPPDFCPAEKARRTKRREEAEMYLQDRDMWFLVTVDPRLDEKGRYAGAAHIVRDITERKRAEEALRESEERYRSLFESSPVGVGLASPDGKVVSANKAMLDITGYSAEEVPQVNLNDIYVDLEDRKAILEQVKKYGSVSNFPAQQKRKDGTVIDTLLSVSAVQIGGKQLLQATLIDITERKRASEILRESEEKFRLAFENAKDAIFWADPETGSIINCNKAAEILLEKKREEIIGQLHTTLHPPKKAELYADMFRRHIREKGAPADEAEVVTKSGKTVAVHVAASLTKVGGKPVIQGIFRDITDLRRAEEALRESEEKWRTLVQNIPDIIITVLSDGTIEALNRVVTGRPMEEVVGTKIYDYVNTSQVEALRKSLERAVETGELVAYEVLGDGAAGPRSTWYETRIVPIKRDGEIVAVTLISTDITERRRAENELRQSEKRFRDISDCSLDWIWEVDAEGRYTYASPAVEVFLGYMPQEVVGKYYYDFFHPDDREQLKKEAFAVFARKEHFREFINRNVHKDGKTVWLSTSGTPILDADGNLLGYRGSDTDITERKKAEEQLKAYSQNLEHIVEERTRELDRARSRLFHSSKLAALGRMGAGIAHQLNSPICSGLLSVDSLTQDYKNVPKQKRVLQNLRQSLMGMHDVVNCMLSMTMVSRPGVPARANVDLNQVLNRVLELAGRECDKHHIQVETLFDPDLPPIEAAVGELDQVFVNLVNNAVDAMEDGGKLTVHTVRLPEGIEVHMQDTGKGITPEHLDQIFEPFFTTRMAERGIGLGLSMAREIVERYGGEIGVVSQPGKGSTFSVRLPSQRPKQEPRH